MVGLLLAVSLPLVAMIGAFIISPQIVLRRLLMKRYWMLVVAIMLFFLISFLIVDQLQIPILTDPHFLMQNAGIGAALLGVALLIADVFLPVPSSIIMLLNGALFGILPGALLSLTGTMGADWLGFYLGRASARWLNRLVPPEQVAQANALLEKWGLIAVIVTRPVPILAETLTIVAGTSRMSWLEITLASLAGSLPMVILYAIVGATAATWDGALLSFGLVIVIAAVVWLLRAWLYKRIRHFQEG
jgi:uncharacterized membrane protein YdjX (TVP38/TMEM64 family)